MYDSRDPEEHHIQSTAQYDHKQLRYRSSKLKKLNETDRPTDRPTDRQTDKPSYRAAQWQLLKKIISNMDFNMQAKTAIYQSSVEVNIVNLGAPRDP